MREAAAAVKTLSLLGKGWPITHKQFNALEKVYVKILNKIVYSADETRQNIV